MTVQDSIELIAGVPLIVVIPALVELAKRTGLPVRFAGVASIAMAISLLALGGLALGVDPGRAEVARWIVGGVVYGLAAAGLYSQRNVILGGPSEVEPN